MMEGKKTEAEAFLQQTKQDLSDNPIGYRMLGDFYFATGDLDKAVTEYESSTRSIPRICKPRKTTSSC